MEFVWRFVKAVWRFLNGLVTFWMIVVFSFWAAFWAVTSYHSGRMLTLHEIGLLANQPRHHSVETELR